MMSTDFDQFEVKNADGNVLPLYLSLPYFEEQKLVLTDSDAHRFVDADSLRTQYRVALKNPLSIPTSSLDMDQIAKYLGDKVDTEGFQIFFAEGVKDGAIRAEEDHHPEGPYFASTEAARAFTQTHAAHIYMDTEFFCDNDHIKALLQSMGYDGIINKVQTWGSPMQEVQEYRPFCQCQMIEIS